jgi:peptidoglycan/LPS O-acetylase OafA/YrhL
MDRGLSQPRRLAELDAMRGIAAMFVLLYHFNYKYVQYNPDHGALPLLFGWGHHGVSIFFAISGFVIAMTLERMDGVGAFARARFSRLFPVYWASMLVTIMVVAMGGASKLAVSPAEAIANTTMLHYWFDIQSVDGSYWSLSIELSFYLVMALVLRLGLLGRIEAVLAGWIALSVAQQVTGILPLWASRMLALEYIPLFAIGIIHYRHYRGWAGWQRTAAWHIALVGVAALSGLSVAIVAAGTIALFWGMTLGLLRFLALPPLLWLGAISYPLYLVHQYVGYVLIDHLAGSGLSLLASTAVAIAAVVLLAHVLHIGIENPAQRRLRRRSAGVKMFAE